MIDGLMPMMSMRQKNPTDPNTLLLLNFDGNFSDISQYNATVTAFNGATTSTDTPKFGNGEGVFDGVDNNLQIANTLNRYNFGTGDFCIQMFVTFDSPNSDCSLISGVGAGSFMLAMKGSIDSRRIAVGRNLVAWDSQSSAQSWVLGQYYFIQVNRASGVLKILVDGVEVFSGANTQNYVFNGTLAVGVRITSGGALSQSPHNGSIDCLRISNIARPTAVPTAPFTS